jgi:RluA family pseudouridine synthase
MADKGPRKPIHTTTVRDVDGTARLDRALRTAFPAWGRQTVDRLITGSDVTVNGKSVWLASWKVKNGDRIDVFADPMPKSQAPQAFDDAWIIADEPHWLVVDKPAGLLSHRTRWGDAPGLLELAQARFPQDGETLALFHRLDRDTSGVVLFSRTPEANRYLDHLFKARLVGKEYLAVVPASNRLSPSGEINLPLAQDPARRDKMHVVKKGGKWALTRYEVLGTQDDLQLVRCWPVTGRTHQLRVHLAAMGAPIVGDRLYAGETDVRRRLMLHAHKLVLPAYEEWAGQEFQSPVPEEFARFRRFM